MYPNTIKPWWQPDTASNESSLTEHVDAFILNPNASQALVWHLLADPAWDITCEEPDLVIFVRSTSGGIQRKDRGLWQ